MHLSREAFRYDHLLATPFLRSFAGIVIETCCSWFVQQTTRCGMPRWWRLYKVSDRGIPRICDSHRSLVVDAMARCFRCKHDEDHGTVQVREPDTVYATGGRPNAPCIESLRNTACGWFPMCASSPDALLRYTRGGVKRPMSCNTGAHYVFGTLPMAMNTSLCGFTLWLLPLVPLICPAS
jgi:hypothetical protein